MDNLDWNLISRALSHRIEQLNILIKMYNHNPDQHMHDLEVVEHELEICKKEYRQVLIAQQQSNKKLTPKEKIQYLDLQNYYSNLTKEILGDNYYTSTSDVSDSANEAYYAMINKLKHIKMDLAVYKQLFYFLTILNLMALVWSLL